MNGKLVVAVLGTFLFAGCIISGGDGGTPPPATGNITFSWTFAQQSCAQTPQVATVQVLMPGQVLANSGVYACNTGGYDGIVLHDFTGGDYAFTLNGLDSAGNTLYSTSGSVTVDGDVSVSADLAAVANSFAKLTWSFPQLNTTSNPSCTQVGVANVNITIDGVAAPQAQCIAGQGAGVTTPALAAGSHAVVLSALDANNAELYNVTGTVITAAGQTTAQSFTFQWSVGGAAISWNLNDATGVQETCSQALVTTLDIQLLDSSNHPYFSTPAQVQCASGTVQLQDIVPGTYSVQITGTDSNGGTFSSNTSPAPSVQIQAGVFSTTPLQITVKHQ